MALKAKASLSCNCFMTHTAEKYAFKSGLVVKAEQVTLMQELPAVTDPGISTLGNSVVHFTSC